MGYFNEFFVWRHKIKSVHHSNKRDQPEGQIVGSNVFAYGEDTHTLRLQASLTRFGGVCELTLATRDKLKSSVHNNKRDQTKGQIVGSKVFADGEDTHTLRLQASLTRFGGVCELTLATRNKFNSVYHNNKRDQPEGLVSFVGRGSKI